MIIDICGFSGSGKTTLLRRLFRELRERGYAPIDSRSLLDQNFMPPKSSQFVSNTEARRMLYWLAKFRFDNQEFMAIVDQISVGDYMDYVLLCEYLAGCQAYRSQNTEGLSIVNDEGLIYRICNIYSKQVYTSMNIESDKNARALSLETFGEIVALMPDIDVEILIDVDPKFARDRVVARHIERKRNRNFTEKQLEKAAMVSRRRYPDLSFLDYRRELFHLAFTARHKNEGVRIIVDGKIPPEEVARQVIHKIGFSNGSSGGQGEALPVQGTG